MKKIISLNLITLVLVSLCSCNAQKENTKTAFMLDTVVTLTADCDEEVLDGALSLCKFYENLLSKTVKESDVYRLNNSDGLLEVAPQTAELLKKAVYYCEMSGGSFDITLYDVISLWDFNNEVVPSRDEIASALKNVDYQSIEIKENSVNLNGKRIDLGAIAKGYIADKIKQYFIDNEVASGIINLGGNIVVFGKEEKKIGIKKPFSQDELCATVTVQNKSVVTSGIYERCFEKEDEFYHHILDKNTGFPAKTDLASATIIADNSVDADALSTVCMLYGSEAALRLVEGVENTECILVSKSGDILYSSGLYREIDDFYLK